MEDLEEEDQSRFSFQKFSSGSAFASIFIGEDFVEGSIELHLATWNPHTNSRRGVSFVSGRGLFSETLLPPKDNPGNCFDISSF